MTVALKTAPVAHVAMIVDERARGRTRTIIARVTCAVADAANVSSTRSVRHRRAIVTRIIATAHAASVHRCSAADFSEAVARRTTTIAYTTQIVLRSAAADAETIKTRLATAHAYTANVVNIRSIRHAVAIDARVSRRVERRQADTTLVVGETAVFNARTVDTERVVANYSTRARCVAGAVICVC